MSTLNQHTILMLDDDMDDRHIVESFFVEKAYNVQLEFLDDGDKVFAYLNNALNSNRLPSIILLDLNMPRRNGLDVLREIKSNSQFRAIPVVIVSGTAHPDEVTESYRLGANTFAQKPFTDQLTMRKIQTFFDYWFLVAELPVVNAGQVTGN